MSALSSSNTQLVFSVSGPRGTGRTGLYQELAATLPGLYPEKEFAFLGNPFGNLAHPHFWDVNKRGLQASTRLLECWAQLNEFVCAQLRPALEVGRIVVTKGFGLDAWLHATAHCASESEYAETSKLHHLLVQARLGVQEIAPPIYLLAFDDAKNIAARTHQNSADVEILLEHEKVGIRKYFDGTGQKLPQFLEGRSTEERLDEALIILNEYL